MRYIVAATSEAILRSWRRGLADLGNVQFKAGYGTETVGDADAAIVQFYLAHDRYGGKPEIGRSQLLRNERNDGYPRYILTTPPFLAGKHIEDAETFGDRLFFTFSSCILAAQAHNAASRDDQIKSLYLHVDGMGLERFPEGVAVEAFRRAVVAYGSVCVT